MTVDVLALGAWCDLVPAQEYSASPVGVSFTVHEFAELDDGRRVTLHSERGFTSWLRSTSDPQPADQWAHLTPEGLESDVRTVVLPDDDNGEDHPWQWLAGLLRRHGVDASIERLSAVPYRVEFSERLTQKLSARSP